MSQATAITTMNARPVSMLDAINPNRARFTLVPTVTKPPSATNLLIEVLAVELASKGPVFPKIQNEPRNPYATSWGKVIDQPKFTALEMARIAAQVAARKGGAL